MNCVSYVVQKGDTLYAISRNLRVGLDAILAANPFVNIYNLKVGEVICIPINVPSNRVNVPIVSDDE